MGKGPKGAAEKKDIFIAIDAASSEFYNVKEKHYFLESVNEKLSSDDMVNYWVSWCKKYPILLDDDGEVLSFPPIINSNHTGKVEEGDSNLFFEVTGTDMNAVLVSCNGCFK